MYKRQISESANLILPFHREMDEIREDAAGKSKIGTTRRGIGPAYEDKVGRRSIRVMDLRSEKNLDQRLDSVLVHHNAIRKGLGKKIFEKEQLKSDLLKIAPKILEFSQPVWLKIDQFKKQKKKILFEGAQGILLDVDHGTYPFVTSSNTTIGGIFTGTGISPKNIDYTLAIVKAYTTRVGSGPFMTELFDDNGKILSEKGHEFGATTGRERRCGWLDLVALKRSIEINGFSGICLTKLDVLDSLDKIQVCIEYKNDTPIYKEYKGWKKDISKIKNFDDLPENTKIYVKEIAEYLNTPIDIISNGPGREENIIMNNFF